jgi:hypothetical protein
MFRFSGPARPGVEQLRFFNFRLTERQLQMAVNQGLAVCANA